MSVRSTRNKKKEEGNISILSCGIRFHVVELLQTLTHEGFLPI